MSERKPYNPPAFPIPNDPNPGSYETAPGMSLRDWYAGQFLAGAMTHFASGPDPFEVDVEKWRNDLRAQLAADAYVMADAMLAARGEG